MFLWDAGLGRARRRAERRPTAELDERRSTPDSRRPDQHPVHVGHDRASRRAPRSRTATSSTTAASWPSCRASRSADRVCIPVPFYHCFGMVMGNLGLHDARRDDGHPERRVRPAARCSQAVQAERCTALYGVPTMFIAELGHERFAEFDLSSLRTGVMAGSPCPVEVMKRVHRPDAHGRRDHLLRDDRDVAGVDADAARRHARAPAPRPSAARTRTSRSASPTRRPATTIARGETGEFCTRGYSVMTGYWNDPERTARGDRRRRLDAHRRPRRDGRRRLRQHRRADQGHGDPRRREHLPARDRGVPLHPPRHRGRPGDRRARREVRRGADGVDQAAPRGERRPRRRSASSATAGSPTTRCRAT